MHIVCVLLWFASLYFSRTSMIGMLTWEICIASVLMTQILTIVSKIIMRILKEQVPQILQLESEKHLMWDTV